MKIMLCAWWDHCGIIYFVFLKYTLILDTDLKSQQLLHIQENLRNWLILIYRRNVFLHGYTRIHSERITLENISYVG